MGIRIESAIWEERREWIQKFAQSGLSLAQFCRDNELSPVNFRSWRRKLEPQAKRQRESKKKSLRSDGHDEIQQGESRAGFVQLQAPVQPSSPWIEISMIDGMMIRVPASNLSALDRVLNAIQNRNAIHDRELKHA